MYCSASPLLSSQAAVTDRFGISREKLAFLFVAALALFCGYIPAALGLSPLLSITIAITAMVIVFLTLGRLTKNKTLP
jgi:Flp pilus assembly protein TadB